ncbi:TolC family protein [Saccharicrinis sp. FJH2]|uniref:TolC family protein n=1 Tax=Saccharicrinis sp. FJH65 TaxID=3344659 RepID=UPI0035F31E4C
MNTLKLLIALSLLPVLAVSAQDKMDLSLDEAKSYALDHNKTIQNAELDKELAKKSVWEAISSGLPQVSASFDYTNFFNYEFAFSFGGGGTGLSKEQTSGIINDILTNEYPTANPSTILASYAIDSAIQSNMPTSSIRMRDQASAKLQVSQLVFSGQFLVGIQSAKLAKEIMNMSYNKTENEVTDMVISSYYLTLITQESLRILKENIGNLDKMVSQTQAMVDAGMAEQIDADQLKITSVQLKNSLKSMERNLEMNYNMLRFQLGVEPGTPLNLTTTLDDVINSQEVIQSTLAPFVIDNNIDYQLFKGQEKVQEKQVMLQKSAYLPTISAFYSYNAKIITTDFDLNPPHTIGFSVNLPLFTSWNRQTKVQKAEIQLDKVRNSKAMLEDQLNMQSEQLKYNLKTAIENYNLQKENVEVAKRVYDTYNRKYNEGVISSLELTQSNSTYLEAESNYIQSVMSMLQAKLALDKLNNNL